MVRINPKRDSSLGQIGERLAVEVLVKASFKNVRNLNDEKRNYPFADIFAERDKKRYVISVKARNKYEVSGKLNSRYKLGKKVYDNAPMATRDFNATPAFLAIQLDNNTGTYCAYFGELSVLQGNNAILMEERHLHKYDCLAKNAKSDFNYSNLTNTY